MLLPIVCVQEEYMMSCPYCTAASTQEQGKRTVPLRWEKIGYAEEKLRQVVEGAK
jgi:hypothetical protein